MEFQTVILRFRDLVDNTITRHREVIDQGGYVWWGWWKKGNEKTPSDEFAVLKMSMETEPKYIYLMDSGQEKLYKAKCTGLIYSDKKELSPEAQHTPQYYKKEPNCAWFKFEEIVPCDNKEIENYTCVQVDSVLTENSSNYEKFYNKKIFNVKELIQQDRSIWFVRNYEEGKDSNYEIRLLDANVIEPHNFSEKYYETGSDSLLWLSDLHLGTKNVFKVKMENSTDITLFKHMKKAYEDIEGIGGLIITGDITSFGQTEGFNKAKDLIIDLNNALSRKLKSENIIFCPGNHDFIRKNEKLGSGVPEKVSDNPESFKAYKEFYSLIHHINPNEYMACGRKLLMSSGRTVEIAALNSLMLQQYEDFEGHGFLSEEQLEYTAEKMGWKEKVQTNSVRIVIMHHHYLPACFIEQVEVKKSSSVVYDAERLMQWLVKYDVKLLLHGHKHQTFISKVGCFDKSCSEISEDMMKNIYVIGMGGTGADQCENKFAALAFYRNEIELKFYKICASGTEADTCIQTVHIPI